MNQTNPGTGQPPKTNRRALIMNHQPLLNDPEVVAFLDNHWTADDEQHSLEKKLIRANEPALLLELARTTECDSLRLNTALDGEADLPSLPEGLLEYLAEHINLAPSVMALQVADAHLTAAACTHLQNTLKAPGCHLFALTFINCRFADAGVQFPTLAPTITELHWGDDHEFEPGAAMDQCLPSLAGWQSLSYVSLLTMGAPMNFANIGQLLLANHNIESLHVISDVAPVAPGQPGFLPQHEPAALMDLIGANRTALKQLWFKVTDTHDTQFNDRCLRSIAGCLFTNTTLNMLEVPGFTMCTPAAQRRFDNALNRNHALIELGPLDVFGDLPPAPVRRNRWQHFWFTTDFILGAAQALMQLAGGIKDAGALVASHLAPTAAERAYCGATMALVCKATHQGAVALRSAVLREAIKSHIRAGDHERCQALVHDLIGAQLSLLPADHRAIVRCATALGRLDFLPAGFAG